MKKLLAALLAGAAAVSLLFVATAKAQTYVIQKGDTLFSISQKFGTTVDALASSNNIENPNLIYAGKTLTVLPEEMKMGAGYAPVTGYQSRTTQYINSSAVTIPVASTQDPSGQQIVLSNISPTSTVKIYMNLEPGTSREEAVYCTGVTTVSWTGCVRGLAFQGASETSSSTLSFAHNAGSKIIITNIGQFYNQYVSIDGAQDIWGIKTFRNLPSSASVTTVPTTADQLATKYYVDTVGAGGFTAANVSTTRGLSVDGSSPERVGVNASTTGALAFDSAGKLYFSGVVNTSTIFNAAETHNGTVTVPTPTGLNTSVATNVSYVDQKIVFNNATGTAQVAITAGQAVWMSATSSQIMITNSSVASSTYQFVGIAASTTSAGQTLTFTKPGGINCNQSGLTPGVFYYLNGTTGQISSTPGTYFARIGTAITASCISITNPKFIATGYFAGGGQPAGAASTTNVGFYPAHVELRAGCGSSPSSGYGFSVGDETNTSVSFGYNSANYIGGTDASNAVRLYCNNAAVYTGTISSRSQYGFVTTLTGGFVGGIYTIQYTAYSE